MAGYKVGATGPGTRRQFGMDGPVRGFLYDTELHPSGATLSHASYANLAVEGELAVWLGDGAEFACILPVIELHNYVFRSETPTLQELIANSGLHAGVVLPDTDGTEWSGEEPLDGVLRVEINDRTVEEGSMSGVPGGVDGVAEAAPGGARFGLAPAAARPDGNAAGPVPRAARRHRARYCGAVGHRRGYGRPPSAAIGWAASGESTRASRAAPRRRKGGPKTAPVGRRGWRSGRAPSRGVRRRTRNVDIPES